MISNFGTIYECFRIFFQMQNFIEKHDSDFRQSTNVSKYVDEIQANFRILMNLKEPDNRIAIFGRNSTRPESLFEIILSVPGIAAEHHDNLIEIIWDKFDLVKSPEILQVVSVDHHFVGKEKFSFQIFALTEKSFWQIHL